MAEPDLVGHHFTDVDAAPDPSKLVSYLDQATSLGPIQRLKRATYELLSATPGQVVLDVGCGVGDDVRTLAGIVGSTGRAVGLDLSRTLISQAHARSKDKGVQTHFAQGDSCCLPFPDQSFDAVRSERMLQHLREPRRAVNEMARVVKSGGRVVDFDPDWDLIAIDSSDAALTRKIVRFRTDRIATGSVGRKVSNLFKDAGLVDVTVVPMASVLTSLAAASTLELELSAEDARRAGIISDDEASGWVAEMRERDAAGRFFCGICGYLTSGRKP